LIKGERAWGKGRGKYMKNIFIGKGRSEGEEERG